MHLGYWSSSMELARDECILGSGFDFRYDCTAIFGYPPSYETRLLLGWKGRQKAHRGCIYGGGTLCPGAMIWTAPDFE